MPIARRRRSFRGRRPQRRTTLVRQVNVADNATNADPSFSNILVQWQTEFGVTSFMPGTTVGQCRVALSIEDTSEAPTNPLAVAIAIVEEDQDLPEPGDQPIHRPADLDDRQDSYLMFHSVFVPAGGVFLAQGVDELRTRAWRRLEFGNTLRIIVQPYLTTGSIRVGWSVTTAVKLP